jgi:cytosine/adenosine deaminase-related metal-dependent hydrolase
MTKAVLYRAPFVVPVSGPIIEDGAILVLDGKIEAVGRYADLRGQGGRLVDLDQRILTPALINCHSHLELSCLAELGRDTSAYNRCRTAAGGDITQWIGELLRRRQTVDSGDEVAAAVQAAQEMRRGGVALALDIGNLLNCSSLALGTSPEIDFFLEFLGLDPAGLAGFEERLSEAGNTPCTAHAPHTTHPRMIQKLKKRSLNFSCKFPIHVAESTSEIEFLEDGSGAFRDFIIARLGRLDFYTPPACGAVEYLDRLGVLDSETICVHAIHISELEAELLAARAAKVCLCPGSNRILGVGRAKVDLLLNKGLKPCLGTDSLASNKELSLWREMRILCEEHPAVDPAVIFGMATINGAMAAGRPEFGTLEPGKSAKILAVEFDDLSKDEVSAYLVNSGKPTLTWLEDVDA